MDREEEGNEDNSISASVSGEKPVIPIRPIVRFSTALPGTLNLLL